MKKKINLEKLKSNVEPKKINKNRGLGIAISLIEDLVNLDTLPAHESHIISQSLIVLEKIKSGEVLINEVSQTSKPIIEVKPKVTVKYIDCPVCKCKLSEKNLEKHLEKVHPRKSKPKKLRESKKKVDMLDSWVMVSGSFGSGKRR